MFFVVLTADARVHWLQLLCPCLKIEDQLTKRSGLYSKETSTSSLITLPPRKDSILQRSNIISETILEEEEEIEDSLAIANLQTADEETSTPVHVQESNEEGTLEESNEEGILEESRITII